MVFDLSRWRGVSGSSLAVSEEIGNVKTGTLIWFVICFFKNVSPLQHFSLVYSLFILAQSTYKFNI